MVERLNRLFVVFQVLALLAVMLFSLNPSLFLVCSPLLGLVTLRVLVGYFHGNLKIAGQEIISDIKHGYWSWGVLVALASYCVTVYPGALVLAPVEWSVVGVFWVKTSVFKPIGLLIMVGLLQLEVRAPRSLVASYWVKVLPRKVVFRDWIRNWNREHPAECVKGLGYVVLVYTLSMLCPVFVFAALAELLRYYTITYEREANVLVS